MMKITILILLINTLFSNLNNIPCFVDEKSNSIGPGKCQASIDCKGERKCNVLGYCFG